MGIKLPPSGQKVTKIYTFLSSNLPIRSVFIIAADFEEGAAIDLDIKQQSYMKHLLRC